MAEFVLELYSEEIPALMQARASYDIAGLIGEKLKLDPRNIENYFTPQRIVIHAKEVDETIPDSLIEKRGPKVGAPEQAVQGFLKSVGLSKVEDAQTIEEKGQKYYFYQNTVKGESTEKHLAKILPEILNNFTWPKSMRWGSSEIRWVRPLHSIVAIFGGKVIPFSFGNIKSENKTRGHRFLDNSEITVANFEQYKKDLESKKVILDQTARQQKIWDDAKKAAGKLSLKEDVRLLAEVANLVEFPVILVGEFAKEFLDVPQECLIATMKNNQKYFPLFDGEKLSNKFIVVANKPDSAGKIISGNQRVVKARLSDAKFFWDVDRETKLEEFLPKLSLVTFHAKVGNMLEKAKRISALSAKIAKLIGADEKKSERAGLLCKADLVTGMVGEFAELQGIMGGYYSASEGSEISAAIKNHYKPLGAEDEVPTDKITICVALADKIDSLVKLWEAGEKPTGSSDPYALRRAAISIIRIILGNNLKLNLQELIGNKDVFEFITDRLKQVLKTQNIRHDYITAVLDRKSADLVSIRSKAEALGKFLETASGKNLLESYKRAANILSIEEKKDKTIYALAPKEALLVEAEEKILFKDIIAAEPKIVTALKAEKYEDAMQQLANLQPAVNSFFERVTVNAKEPDLRKNRLKLLAKIRNFINSIADFSKIEG